MMDKLSKVFRFNKVNKVNEIHGILITFIVISNTITLPTLHPLILQLSVDKLKSRLVWTYIHVLVCTPVNEY